MSRLNQYLTEATEQLKDWNSYVRRIPMLKAGVKVLKKIEDVGFSAFIVGGPIRDLILGLEVSDIDIATDASITDLQKLFKVYDVGKSKKFGSFVIRQDGFNIDITQFRVDGKYKDGRRPESIKVAGSFEEDASRRDFTISAMAIDKDGIIYDYFDGRKDIKNKILKTVGDPYKRFGEDYLRILRAGRFASKLDFDIDKGTKKAAKKLSTNIMDLSPERIRDELIKSAKMSGDKFAKYIQILDKLKILKLILPEVCNLKWFKENLVHHPETRGKGRETGTVYAHTIEALKQVGADQPIAMLSVLLHDIGKGVSLSYKEGLPRYLRHAKASIELSNSIADRLKMSNKERDAIIFAVGNHMKFHDLLGMKNSKIAKLVADDNWDTLVQVAKADEFSRGDTFKHAGEFEKIVDKAIKIKEKFGIKGVEQRLKLVDGNNVMFITGLKPGKEVGEIIKKVTEWILDNNITDKEEIDKKIRSLV